MKKISTKEEVIQEIKNLHKKIGRRPKRDDNIQLNSVARKFFGIWTNALKTAGYEVKMNQKPKIPDKLTPELCYLVGLIITDGHLVEDIKRGHYILLLFTSYEEEKNLILGLIKKLFNYDAYVRTKKTGFNKRESYEIHVNSKELLYYFKDVFDLPTGSKSNIVRVPKLFFTLNRKLTVNFIRGVIDGDGNVSLKKPINISSGSYEFLKDLKILFFRLGLESSEIYKDRTAYILRLYLRQNLKAYNLFYNNILLCYPRKKEMLETNIFKNQNLY